MSTPWKECGHLRGTPCSCAAIRRDQRRYLNRLNAAIRAQNREIERGNRRRRYCLEKILEWCIRGNETKARVWITKLASAGFDSKDAAEMETMDLKTLEEDVRRLLGIRPPSVKKGENREERANGPTDRGN